MMKLSYRDKVIAVVLIVIVIIVAGVIVFVKPMAEKTTAAQKELEQIQQEKTTVEEKIATFEVIQSGILQSLDNIDEYQQGFFLEGYGYELERELRAYCEETGVTVKSLEFESKSTALAPASYVPSPYWLAYQMKMDADLYNQLPQVVYDLWNQVKIEVGASQVVGSTTFTITFETTDWEDLMGIVDKAATHENAIYIPSFDASTVGGEGQDRSLVFTIYHIVPMDLELVRAAEENDGVLPAEYLTEDDETAEETVPEEGPAA
jgi:molybdopterin-biosynthesis enzyme MoeA-like protein